MNKKIILSDGTEFVGKAFGCMQDTCGEVIFVTSMTGYQELLTTPTLLGKIVVMTYPLIGNYGINRDDYEALQPYVHGFVVREYAKDPSNFRMNKSLEDYLKKMQVTGLYGIDTRKLAGHIRENGSMKAIIVDADISKEQALAKLQEQPKPESLLKKCSTQNIYQIPASGKRVVLLDCGTKASIVRSLSDLGYHLTVVPYNTDAADILDLNPDAVVIAGGPEVLEEYPELVQTVKEVLGKVVLFGIGSGQHLLALACGADIKKLKFGHYGSMPIRRLPSGKIISVSATHSYTVHHGTLAGTDLEPIAVSVNDDTIQGLRHKKYPAFSVQFQPEGAPGGKDGFFAFEMFRQMLEK